MWLALIPLLSNLFGESGPLATYLKTKAAKVQADAELALQVQKDKLTLSSVIAQAEVDSQANKIAMTTPTVKAWVLAIMNLPIIINCISPSYGQAIFSSLNTVPQYYALLDVAVVGTIFGLPVAANWMSTVFSTMQQAWLERQPLKIEKAKVLNEQVLATELRKTLFKNGMTQEQWDAILNATKTAGK